MKPLKSVLYIRLSSSIFVGSYVLNDGYYLRTFLLSTRFVFLLSSYYCYWRTGLGFRSCIFLSSSISFSSCSIGSSISSSSLSSSLLLLQMQHIKSTSSRRTKMPAVPITRYMSRSSYSGTTTTLISSTTIFSLKHMLNTALSIIGLCTIVFYAKTSSL